MSGDLAGAGGARTDDEDLLASLPGGEQAAALEHRGAGGEDRAERPAAAADDLGREPAGDEPPERLALARDRGLDEQQRAAGGDPGGGGGAEAVDQRPPVAPGVPGAGGAAGGELVARGGQVGRVRENEVEAAPGDGGEEVAAKSAHADAVDERVEADVENGPARDVDGDALARAGEGGGDGERAGAGEDVENAGPAGEAELAHRRGEEPGVAGRAQDAAEGEDPHRDDSFPAAGTAIPPGPASPSASGLERAFESVAPLTVGVEEELMLLDPETLDLVPRSAEVLARVEDDGRFKPEFPAAQLEIATAPTPGAAAAIAELAAARRDLSAVARGIALPAAIAVHPFAAAEGELAEGERYDDTFRRYGRYARRQLLGALQVHVAVGGAERTLAVYNALRSHLPELTALAAAGPFYRGRDTTLATVRPKIAELLPRQGVPPAIASWEEFAGDLRWGADAGGVADPGMWWWELRPHHDFGTLEVRAPDAQATVADAAGIVALVQALIGLMCELHDAGEPLPVAATWRIEENRWSAIRNGVEGEMADLETGVAEPTRTRLTRLLDEVEPVAERLGSAPLLAEARRLVEENGAIRQRRIAAEDGVRGVAAALAEGFLSPYQGAGPG